MMTERRLAPVAATVMNCSDSERIKYLKKPKWISYRDADSVMEKMFELAEQDRSKGSRMENLILHADASNGKSFLAHTFRERINAEYDAVESEFSEEGKSVPAVLAEFPVFPDERRLYSQILKAAHIPHSTKDSCQHLLNQIEAIFIEIRVRVLILDEFHNLLCGTSKQQRRLLIVLKSLSNQIKLPIVLIGTLEAKSALYVDPQFATRFSEIQLPLWSEGKKIKGFLKAYETVIPLKGSPSLTDVRVMSRIVAKSRGLVGEMSKLVRVAAIEAIRSGAEVITPEIVDGIDLNTMHGSAEKPT